MDEDEDAEEKRRRMEAKIAAENFGAVIGFAAGVALAVKEKLDEQVAREEQKKQQHEQTMGGLYGQAPAAHRHEVRAGAS